ncbi:nuclear-pore anchor-like, partial [Neltuma alba]
MRQVKEMAVEFVNALNAAAAAESECAKLRRLLEEQRKLMQRLKEEKEEEAQMARRKIERMSQRLAEAQKDVEYASARADVAENEWVKLKRELQEALQFVELLKPESKEMTQSVLRQVDDKELELANAINAASIAE